VRFWREKGARPVLADLDQPASLQRIAGLADVIVHLAPPPNAADSSRSAITA
jgi:nucleoside-diphosphate-sugar epimerase